jgi:hypothetical protein
MDGMHLFHLLVNALFIYYPIFNKPMATKRTAFTNKSGLTETNLTSQW